MPSRINRTLKHVSPWNPTNFYALNASGSPQRYAGGFRSALETTALGYYNYLKMLAAGARLIQLQSIEKHWVPARLDATELRRRMIFRAIF